MNYIKLFEEYGNDHVKGFTDDDYGNLRNIMMVSRPNSWEEVEEQAIDLDDLDNETLKSLFKIPVYTINDINDIFKGQISDNYNIKDGNWIFFEYLKIPYQFFILRFIMNNVDCGLLVDTQGFNYMRYVTMIKEFGDMYDYYKKDLELRNRN